MSAPSIPTCNIGNLKCLRVTNTATGRAFDYVHVDWTGLVSDGSIVTVSSQIGVIQPASVDGNHLHLNEKLPTLSVLVNPEFPGRLDFIDSDRPQFATPTVEPIVGSEKVILVDRDGDPYPTPYAYRGGIFYVSGRADIFATARNGSDRKGLYRVGTNAYPIIQGPGILSPPTQASGNNNLVFGLMQDAAQAASEVQTIYWRRQSNADTFIVTSKFTGPDTPQAQDQYWDTTLISEGAKSICVYAQDYPQPSYSVVSQCANAVVDNTNPTITLKAAGATFTVATATPIVTVEGTDLGSGIYAIKLEKSDVSYSSTNYVSGVQTTASNQFPDSGNLNDGSYTATVTDLAGNQASVEFTIDTGTGTSGQSNAAGAGLPSTFVSTHCLVAKATDTLSGIASINISASGGGFSSTGTFACVEHAEYGPFCELPAGDYIATYQDCASNNWNAALSVTTAALSVEVCGENAGSSAVSCYSNDAVTAAQLVGTSTITVKIPTGDIPPLEVEEYCKKMSFSAFGRTEDGLDGCEVYSDSPRRIRRRFSGSASWWAGTTTWRVFNSATGNTNFGVAVTVELFDGEGNGVSAGGSFDYSGLAQGEGIDGVVSVSEALQAYPTPEDVFKASPTVNNVSASTEALTGASYLSKLWRVLAQAVAAWRMSGSDIVFTSTIPVSFSYTDPVGGVVTDTTTLKIYRWSGVDWDSSAVTGQTAFKDAGSGLVTASGEVTQTGLFAAMFDGQDSSAPTTAWSVQGSSSSFQGLTILSTYTYVILSSTDPTVNGYSSGLATTYYRIDGLPGDPYSAYTSSLSFLPGRHWVDYYAVDWAGNPESVQRTTITVTAGSVTKLSGDLEVDGNLLVGFLGSGAKAEVVARAGYDYALRVSSPDGRTMLAVDNANFVSIGTAPASGRLTLQGVSGDTALALRSGNSTASVTGAQLAFGYDGSGDLRHAVLTQHGAAAYNNRLEFALWSPDVSSSSLAGTRVLSLQGSTITTAGALVEVRPADIPGDPADAELEVSNGVKTGGGNVLRAEAVSPSSRQLKKDIRYLTAKDEEQAYKDVAALQPAVFRRRRYGKDGVARSDPSAPEERGLIYEETPKSIRGRPGEIIYDERLVNAELALKAAMRRIDQLKARLEKLKREGK